MSMIPLDGYLFDRIPYNNQELTNVISNQSKEEKKTNGLKPSKKECEEIISYIRELSLKKPTLIEGNDRQISFSTAYNPNDKKAYCLLKEQLSESGKIALCYDIQTLSKMVFKLGVKENESAINKKLSKYKDLFVATNDVQHYCHHNGNELFGSVLVLEYLKCSLHDLINNQRLSLKNKISIASDIAKALDVLHNTCKVVHRHLKLEHILVDENNHAKISNFKDSVIEKDIPIQGLSSDYYLPPEWLQTWSKHRLKDKYEYPEAKFSSDIWCFGVLLLLLFSEKVTQDRWYASWNYKCHNIKDFSKIKDCILKEMVELSPEHEKDMMQEICKLISGCLKIDPSKRIMAQKIVATFNEINALHIGRPSDSSSDDIEEGIHQDNENFNLLNSLHIKKEDLKKIVDYINRTPSEKNWVYKRQIHKLPLTAAYDAQEDNIFIFCNAHQVGRLGQGVHCNVTKGLDVNAQLPVAIRSSAAERILDEEIAINKRLSSRKDLFVVSDKVFDYTGRFTYNEGGEKDTHNHSKPIPKRAMVLELMDRSLDRVKNLTLDQVIFVGCGIAKALKVLHEKYRIVHRDLKTDNIYISFGDKTKEEVKIKLGDFGFAHQRGTHTMAWSYNHCRPPEVTLDRFQYDDEFFKAEKPNKEICSKLQGTPKNADYPEDIWALGVILLELICQGKEFEIWKTIYKNHDELKSTFPDKLKALFDMVKKSYEDSPEEDLKLSHLLHVIEYCLQFDSEDRLTADKVLEHLENIGAK